MNNTVLPFTSETPETTVTVAQIARMIDHSLLRPEMTPEAVRAGCELAARLDCASVCVKPCDVVLAAGILAGTGTAVSTVVGFPHGGHTAEVKLLEARDALEQGCVELDMVINIGRLKAGDIPYVEDEVRRICTLAHGCGALVKVILENAYLTDGEKRSACKLCERAGADFVKTSTGYAGGGATIHDLRLMRDACGPEVKIKAAGGVRTLDALLMTRAAGADRVGASATADILAEAQRRADAGTLCMPRKIREFTDL